MYIQVQEEYNISFNYYVILMIIIINIVLFFALCRVSVTICIITLRCKVELYLLAVTDVLLS